MNLDQFLRLDTIVVEENPQLYSHFIKQEKQLIEHVRNPNALILLLHNKRTHYTMLPSLLNLIESHEIDQKLLGVSLTTEYISLAERKSDYGQLLFKSIFPCTTFLDHPELLSCSIEVLIKLASYTWTKLSKEHDDMLEDILYNGIIQPFIYCKTPEIQLIFINFINELIEPLHIHIFKYLKGLVSIACEILPLPNHCARLSIMKMLFKLYSNAMPRFECYLPEILVAIAEAWRFGSSKELRAEMQDFVQLFRYKDSMQEDLDALISFDTTYNELIYTR